jgi:phosphoribosyl-AMP cyclohydrolase
MDYSKLDGLIPAVIQDDQTGVVLMVGFMNDEAFGRTCRTGIVTFFARAARSGRKARRPATGSPSSRLPPTATTTPC